MTRERASGGVAAGRAVLEASALLAALLLWTGASDAQLAPQGSADVSLTEYVVGGTNVATSHYGNLTGRLLQDLRGGGHLEGEVVATDEDGSYGLNRVFLGLKKQPWGLFTVEASLGDIAQVFSIFTNNYDFQPSPYIYFRGAETRLSRQGALPGCGAFDVTLLGGSVSPAPELNLVGQGGYGGDGSFGGLLGVARWKRFELGLGATYLVPDEGLGPPRTNLQLETRVPVVNGLGLLGSWSQDFSSEASGTNAAAFRFGPSYRSRIVRAEAYVRQSGPDFQDVPGKLVTERDSRGAIALVEVTPDRGPTLFASAQLYLNNLDDELSRPQTDGRTATLQARMAVGEGFLTFQGTGSRFTTEHPSPGAATSETDFWNAMAEYSFLFGRLSSANLGLEYRRQTTGPFLSDTDFEGVSVFGRFYGIPLGRGSLFANGRLERRFPLGPGDPTWQWEATLGGFQSFPSTEVRAQVAYYSAAPFSTLPGERINQVAASLDVTQRLPWSLMATAGGTYAKLARTVADYPNADYWQIRIGVAKSFRWGHSPRVRPGWEGLPPPRGAVVGRVFLDVNENGLLDGGEPLLSAIGVRLGTLETQPTDRKGEFVFTEVPDGSYRLSILLRTLSARYDAVPAVATVAVTGGAVVRYDFRVVLVGIVSGRVLEQTVKDDMEALVPYDGAVVRLTLGGRDLVTSTDEDGRYSFGSVPPGPYRVSVDSDSLPEKAHLLGEAMRAGTMAGGARVPGQDFRFEVPPAPEERIRFPEGPPSEPPPKRPVRLPESSPRASAKASRTPARAAPSPR